MSASRFLARPESHAARQLDELGLAGRSRAQINSAALLIAAAGAIHFAVAPMHFREFALYGVFFVGLGLVQVGLGAALLARPNRRLIAIAAAANISVIGLWVITRTVGLPLAPVPWQAEEIGFTDVTATLLESISSLLAVLLLRTPKRPRQRGQARIAVATAPGFLLAAIGATLGVGAGLSPMPEAYSSAPAIPGRTTVLVESLVSRPGSEPLKSFTLDATVARIAGQNLWTYNGTVPGPELRVTEGDRVRVTLVNHLPKATTVHWHGLVLPNAEDGVAGLTQDAIKPGASFTYEFVANQPGTYWYHSHQDPLNQLVRGLFGSLVVLPRSGSLAEARDYSVVLHNLAGGSDPGVNGQAAVHLDAAPGERIRLRLINAFSPDPSGAPLTPVVIGAPYQVVALDGHDVSQPGQLGPARIRLGMGQRADVVLTMPSSGGVRIGGVGTKPIFPWVKPAKVDITIGDEPIPAPLDADRLPNFDITNYGAPAPDPVLNGSAFDVARELKLNGGMGFRESMFFFNDTFNGLASPYVPPIAVHDGDRVRLRLVNLSPKFHPVHLHGHIFTVLARNGRAVSGSPIHLDAVLVPPGETWDVGFIANNPGIWMLHCHVLNHAAGGMSMTINYEGVATPFTMGRLSGNIPE